MWPFSRDVKREQIKLLEEREKELLSMLGHGNAAHAEALRRELQRVRGELAKLRGGHRAPTMKKKSRRSRSRSKSRGNPKRRSNPKLKK